MFGKLKQLYLSLDNYVADFAFAVTRFPSGLVRPRAVLGYFADTEQGNAQKEFYQALRKAGYRRMPLQFFFPGQTAGCVKKNTWVSRRN